MVENTWVLPDLKTKEDEAKILQALHGVWGVRDVTVQVDTGEVFVSFEEAESSSQDFEQILIELGYDAKGRTE